MVQMSQKLPAVLLQSAFDQQLIVRGSTPDGLTFTLDGVTSFEHQHLFGLTDSYNHDALQISGFFYDHIPARLLASSGGVMDVRTKNGNHKEIQTTAALTNTHARLSLDGPLSGNAGTWTLGGKTSIMNVFSGLGNAERIAWGLDTGREFQVVDSRYTPASTDLVQTGTPYVAFHDVQAKINLETTSGDIIQITAYAGGDDSRETVQRYYQTSNAIRFDERFSLQSVETVNNWMQVHSGLSWWTTVNNWLINTSAHYGYFKRRLHLLNSRTPRRCFKTLIY
jgi:hypothetical protein